jgi:hypothetical protein
VHIKQRLEDATSVDAEMVVEEATRFGWPLSLIRRYGSSAVRRITQPEALDVKLGADRATVRLADGSGRHVIVTLRNRECPAVMPRGGWPNLQAGFEVPLDMDGQEFTVRRI